jgi:glycosyltransferase involved in cell wall biosynthesis
MNKDFKDNVMTRLAELDLSIVVPVKNEEDSVPVLAKEISKAMEGQKWSWECIWIDDGSTDNTLMMMKTLASRDSHHRYIKLNRNYGQSAGMAIGFRESRGRMIATMDGDLQNDPSDIPRLVSELELSHVHMVNGYRSIRRDNIIRKVASKIANSARNRVTGATVRDVGCSLRVFYRECVLDIPVFKGMHRFIPPLVKLQGYSMMEIPVNHRSREFGETKYGISNRLWVGIFDMLGVFWYQRRWVQAKIAEQSEILQDKHDLEVGEK